jgi:hypothetical protein
LKIALRVRPKSSVRANIGRASAARSAGCLPARPAGVNRKKAPICFKDYNAARRARRRGIGRAERRAGSLDKAQKSANAASDDGVGGDLAG